MSPWDIEGRIPGLKVPFHGVGSNRSSSLGSILKGVLDSVCVHPSKVMPVFVIIRCFWLDIMVVGLNGGLGEDKAMGDFC